MDTEETATAELEHQIEASTHSGGTSTIIEEEEEESSAKDSESKPAEEKVTSASPSDKAEFKAPAPVSSVVTYHIGICSVTVYICNFLVIKLFITNPRQKMVIITHGE